MNTRTLSPLEKLKVDLQLEANIERMLARQHKALDALAHYLPGEIVTILRTQVKVFSVDAFYQGIDTVIQMVNSKLEKENSDETGKEKG